MAGITTTAPELLRYALSVGVAIKWDGPCAAYAKITDPRSVRQRRAFEALNASPAVGDVLFGWYYPGSYDVIQ